MITRAIRTSQIFLFVSSKNSNQSLWTSNEISTALEYKKVIIPFRLDESPYNDSVMMKIVSLDRIDCKNEDIAISKLVRAIRHHLPFRVRIRRSRNSVFQLVLPDAELRFRKHSRYDFHSAFRRIAL